MKKAYEKPQILFCSFELSESISAGCDTIANMSRDTSCPVLMPEWGETYVSVNNCDNWTPEFDDSICYHVPADDRNVFSS